MKSGSWILFCLLFVRAIVAQTFVAGNVNGEWTAAGNPYIATGSLFLAAQDTLLIRPGVQVHFTGGDQFNITGHLECAGETHNPVLFTQDTSLVGDRWRGLRFMNTSGDTSVMRHVVIENAVSYSGALSVLEQPVDFSHITIRNCDGVGLKLERTTAELTDILLVNNGHMSACGGGAHLYLSDIVFRRSVFDGNSGMDGGGICAFYSTLLLDSCLIRGNRASIWAGGIFADSSRVTLTHCVVDSNKATSGGGGMIVGYSGVRFERTIVRDNRAVYSDGRTGTYGGFVMNAPGPQQITNCLFIGNWGATGGALRVAGNTWMFNTGFLDNLYPSIVGDVDTIRHCVFSNPNFRLEVVGPSGFGRMSAVNINGDSTDAFGNLSIPANFDALGPHGQFSLHHTSHWIDAGDPNLGLDPDSTLPDIGPHAFYRLDPVRDVTIELVDGTDDIRLRWIGHEEAAEYWIFHSLASEFNWNSASFVGSTPADEFVVLGALSAPFQQFTYVVIASQVSAASAQLTLQR